MYMVSGMKLRSLGVIGFGYWRYRSYLPSKVRSRIEGFLQISGLTSSQLEKIEDLGFSIGLEKSEIRKATGVPVDNMDMMSRGKITLFGVMVAVLVVVAIGFVIAILFNGGTLFDPSDVPTYTYTPGTKYGSISPKDFTAD
jgi:hypothetical protein